MTRAPWFWLLLLTAAACVKGQDPPPPPVPCDEDPTSCFGGHTCWVDFDGSAWICLDAGSGQEGDPCTPTKGFAKCAAGMFCVQPTGLEEGVCTPYCDPNDNQCAGGAECAGLLVESLPKQYVCKI